MRVIAPNKNYTGVSASVTFVNGVGETDSPHLLHWFKTHGYTVEDTGAPDAVGTGQSGDDDKIENELSKKPRNRRGGK